MIETYKDNEVWALFEQGIRSRKWPLSIQRVALRKLQQLHAAQHLADLGVPPGNHLETLRGDRRGQHSIRVNRQYRICFRWDNGAYDVEILDYH